jgi:RNA polymerase sigma-70 factor (ECF subfamily)
MTRQEDGTTFAPDRAQFDSVYRDTYDTVCRYARMLMNNRTEAEAVTTDVYSQVWNNAEGLRGEGPLTARILMLTHRCASARLTQSEREVPGIDSLVGVGRTGPELDPQLLATAATAEVRSAIWRLTPKQQQVLVLRFFTGLTHKEVALRLGLRAGAVRALQLRALRSLRRHIETPRLEIEAKRSRFSVFSSGERAFWQALLPTATVLQLR